MYTALLVSQQRPACKLSQSVGLSIGLTGGEGKKGLPTFSRVPDVALSELRKHPCLSRA